MKNDNDLNLHSMTKLSGWLRYCTYTRVRIVCDKSCRVDRPGGREKTKEGRWNGIAEEKKKVRKEITGIRNEKGIKEVYAAKKAQLAASLLPACYLAVIKSISGCVRIACSGFMITSLLQVVNKLDTS